jgi:DNA-binding NtrC family response regulator
MKRILLIEDDTALGWLISRMLGKMYKIELKPNALDGLSWLMDGNVCDVIITDINMQQFSGLELIESCAESGLYSSIPVIVLSANPDIDSMKWASQVVRTINKPFNPKDLLNAIEFALSSQALQAQKAPS